MMSMSVNPSPNEYIDAATDRRIDDPYVLGVLAGMSYVSNQLIESFLENNQPASSGTLDKIYSEVQLDALLGFRKWVSMETFAVKSDYLSGKLPAFADISAHVR